MLEKWLGTRCRGYVPARGNTLAMGTPIGSISFRDSNGAAGVSIVVAVITVIKQRGEPEFASVPCCCLGTPLPKGGAQTPPSWMSQSVNAGCRKAEQPDACQRWWAIPAACHCSSTQLSTENVGNPE